jgi:SAM-dependent methyltransferase
MGLVTGGRRLGASCSALRRAGVEAGGPSERGVRWPSLADTVLAGAVLLQPEARGVRRRQLGVIGSRGLVRRGSGIDREDGQEHTGIAGRTFRCVEEGKLEHERDREGLAWQTGVWDRMSNVYLQEVDKRFVPVVENVIVRAGLQPGQRVLDLGTGTGAVAERAASAVGLGGDVVGVDISTEMLALAQQRLAARGLENVTFREGRAEALPADDASVDAVLASLSLMYVIDRAVAAREIARVLRPGGRLVAAVWAGPDRCDIVRFQQTAGSFAPPPPVPGVGPGALADTTPFLEQLAAAGIRARVESETLGFDFQDFGSAWDVLAGVTAAQLAPERRQEAKQAVSAAMYPDGDGPRHFRNVTQFIIGHHRARPS